MARSDYDPSRLFTLRVKLSGGTAIITAWEGDSFSGPGGRHFTGCGHTKVDCELRWKPTGAGRHDKSELVFPRGATYVGIPSGQCIDGDYAKEAALSCLAMKPGDTDPDYFESYTDRQLEWADSYGEELSCEALGRYGEP